jgi:hypothetical protein
MTTLSKHPKAALVATKFATLAVTSFAFSLAMTSVASAAAIRTGFNSNSLGANDDNISAVTALGFTANFFGTSYANIYVANNGAVFFNSPTDSINIDLPTTTQQIIAPFSSDVDTRGTGSGVVTYGQGTVAGRNAFAANYVNVGYYPQAVDNLNSFQVVLIDRADTGAGNFDFELNYDKVQWDRGGLVNIGYASGTGTFVQFNGSGNPGTPGIFLDGTGANSLIAKDVNPDGVLGRYTFLARNGNISASATSTAVPEPFTIVGTIIGGAAALRMRKKLKDTNK